MSIRKSTTLELTREGYAAALALEPNGLLLEFIEFRVAKDSQPLASGAWGTEVFRGRVSDYDFLGDNCILFTCAIPAEVDAAMLDSLCLFNREGVIMAQDFITARRKEASTTTYIYAYINMPAASEPIEMEVRTRWTFPQVRNYADLPIAATAARFEYLVDNGHCGGREDYPQHLPMMVMLGCPDPKTIIYPPNEPFTDPDVGVLPPGDYSYKISAFNVDGESLPSQAHSITLEPILAPLTYASADAGHLASGTYYYQVCALSPGGGRSLPSAEVSQVVVKLATPGAPSATEIPDGGGLNADTYYYVVAALSANGETLPSTVTSVVVTDDAGVELSWSSVAGAIGYSVYRGTTAVVADMRLLFQAAAHETVALDWGSPLTDQPPRTVATDSGVRISWDAVPNAIGYKIYGRVTGGSKTLLDEVADDVFFVLDRGDALGVEVVPTTNSTATGVEVKWSLVPGATGYNIYGREDGALGLIGTVGAVSSFIDDGSEVPGAAPPTTNTSADVEWQLVDGTLVLREELTAVTSADRFEVASYTHDNRDLAFATMIDGDGIGQCRRIRWDEDTSEFVCMDKPWDPAPEVSDTVAVWAGPGCCGGECPEYTPEALIWSPPPDLPPLPPQYAHLGVHICGVFLGAPLGTTTNASQAGKAFTVRKNSNYVDSGLLEYIFCNEDGRTDLVTVIDNVIVTPKGNRAPVGDYSSIAQAFANAVKCTIDSIAIPAGIRVIIYRNPNFSGDIIFDQTGPFYGVNGVWRSQSNFLWALDTAVWADAVISEIVPEARRTWLEDDTRELWKNGSMQVVKTFTL